MPLPLALALGDPAGVGPELACAAWHGREAAHLAPFFVRGGAGVLKAAALARGLVVPVERIDEPRQALEAFARALPVLGDEDCDYTPGLPHADGARLALASLHGATALARDGAAAGLVTGPIAKSHLIAIGFDFPGQTEFVAHACGVAARDAVMMLAGPSLRTVPLTVHVALADVPGLVTFDLVCSRTRIAAQGLMRDFGIEAPRIAVTALNPHAGEDGRFGSEDARVVAPAIAALRAEGLDVTGPHSADALFAPHMRSHFDLAICMYHDQALIPIKALDFDSGVNMTLGLPIVRTSPDHGTAFAIAGKQMAHPGATIAAIRMAGDAARRRAA